ncbi:MAG: bifunctional homocysteine S-methyltransferase/methylenetetrahydrofolate reductase [Oscillospiraceae bacterium]|nr:bifunctional homocysteine S-methyltransferase/methylenetetrahydrofolate reductase [Oscillospiraceae bacterium]
MKDIRTYIQEQPLLFDGGMGTYYAARTRSTHRACEWANLTDPQEVEAIHRAYLDAGSIAIKTNTFAVNRLTFPTQRCVEVLEAGYDIACKAAGDKAYVFADIGPIEALDDRDLTQEYRFVADCFLKKGARHFLFETQSSDQYLHEVAAYIKSRLPDAFILISYAVQPDGFTRAGELAEELCRRTWEDENIDAAGFNCVTGARHMVELMKRVTPVEGLFSVMPNAGYPTVRDNRTFYDGSPAYFAQQVATLHALGAQILGGCCGTTPAHIAAIPGAIAAPVAHVSYPGAVVTEGPDFEVDPFWEALCDPQKRPFAVELDPPEAADTKKFTQGARELQAHGADIITIADCPVARTRMDSSLMACKLKRELGINALPHMTCRDRNLNATQALLLGLCAEGIGNVLIVTGDPIPSASRDEVKSVYNFNSRKLIQYIDRLNTAVLPHPFHIFAALNLNVRNFSVQLGLAEKKEANGADAFLTQPVLTEQALENLKQARETLKGRILGGIMPIVSQRNALFINSEISGITVDEKIIELYEGADREKGEELAVAISVEVARRMRPYVDGYYIITPFGRTALVSRIMDEIRKLDE